MSGDASKTHFRDVIPHELREKLLSQGLLSHHTHGESLLFRLRPPEDIRRWLSPLAGLCTYRCLEELRYGGYGRIEWDVGGVAGGIGEWFGELKERTSEWSYRPQDRDANLCDSLARGGMLSHQWSCMGKELLALDRATRVPRDAPYTRRIYQTARAVPEWVVKRLLRHVSLESIEILPMGSSPSDAKIIDIDEFDFLLICDTADEEEKTQIEAAYNKLLREGLVASNDLHKLKDLNNAKGSSLVCSDPIITSIYKHGPAWCVELGWRCRDGHAHELGVDMTLAWRGQARLKPISRHLQEKPVYRHIYDNIDDSQIATEVKLYDAPKTTSCELDHVMCDALASISPNILATYRVLKLVVPTLLPSAVIDTKHGTTLSSCVSSHNLKQLLYYYVEGHNDKAAWEPENLHLRVIEMLQLLLTEILSVSDPNYEDKRWENVHNIGFIDITESHKKKMLDKHSDTLEKTLKEFMNFLRTAYKGSSRTDSVCTAERIFPSRIKYLVYSQHRYHQYHHNNFSMFRGGAIVYKLCHAPMLYTTHPLVQWCEEYVHRLYTSSPGVDLSLVNREHLTPVWAFYSADILSATDVQQHDRYFPKLLEFTLLDELYGKGRLFTSFSLGLNLVGLTRNQLNIELATSLQADVSDNLQHMERVDRAIIHYLCCVVVQNADRYIPIPWDRMCEDMTAPHIHKALNALSFISFAMGQFIKQLQVGHLLVFYVVRHQLTSDPGSHGYYDSVKAEDYKWAEGYLNRIVGQSSRRQPMWE